MYPPNLADAYELTLRILVARDRAALGPMRGVSPRNKEVKAHASNSNSGSSYRSGSPAMAGESFHPHAGIHQVHPERRRGHRSDLVAAECVRAVSLAVPDSRWHADDPLRAPITRLNLSIDFCCYAPRQ